MRKMKISSKIIVLFFVSTSMKKYLFSCLLSILVVNILSAQGIIQTPNGLVFPNFSSAQRDANLGSSLNGTVIFNTTTNLLELRTSNTWKALALSLPICFTESISPTNANVYLFNTSNSTTFTDVTPSAVVSDASNIMVSGLPTGVTSIVTATTSPVYRVNFTISPATAVGSYPVNITASSNCGLSNVSTFNLNLVTCNFTNCAGNCINLQTDVNNCGACGRPSPAHANATVTCVNCVPGFTCNVGYTLCAGSCVNLANDSNNCGSCGRTCPAGHFCVNGVCN